MSDVSREWDVPFKDRVKRGMQYETENWFEKWQFFNEYPHMSDKVLWIRTPSANETADVSRLTPVFVEFKSGQFIEAASWLEQVYIRKHGFRVIIDSHDRADWIENIEPEGMNGRRSWDSTPQPEPFKGKSGSHDPYYILHVPRSRERFLDQEIRLKG